MQNIPASVKEAIIVHDYGTVVAKIENCSEKTLIVKEWGEIMLVIKTDPVVNMSDLWIYYTWVDKCFLRNRWI